MRVRSADVLFIVEGLSAFRAGEKDDITAQDVRLEDIAITSLTGFEKAKHIADERQRFAGQRQTHASGRK